MRYYALLLLAVAAVAQPAIAPPAIGTVRDGSGGLHTVLGVAGNFIVNDAGISNAVSAAFSASAGLVKTGAEVLVLDSTGQITNRYTAPAGPALFAFDRTGAPALAYYSGTLFQFVNNQPTQVNWTGDAVSIASAGPGSASAIVHRDDGLWHIRFALSDGSVENESHLIDVSGPVLLLPKGALLFARQNDLVVRDSNGAERLLPEAFDVDSFEQMGKDWIAVREAGGGRLFALHITPLTLELYQIPDPEVTQ